MHFQLIRTTLYFVYCFLLVFESTPLKFFYKCVRPTSITWILRLRQHTHSTSKQQFYKIIFILFIIPLPQFLSISFSSLHHLIFLTTSKPGKKKILIRNSNSVHCSYSNSFKVLFPYSITSQLQFFQFYTYKLPTQHSKYFIFA